MNRKLIIIFSSLIFLVGCGVTNESSSGAAKTDAEVCRETNRLIGKVSDAMQNDKNWAPIAQEFQTLSKMTNNAELRTTLENMRMSLYQMLDDETWNEGFLSYMSDIGSITGVSGICNSFK